MINPMTKMEHTGFPTPRIDWVSFKQLDTLKEIPLTQGANVFGCSKGQRGGEVQLHALMDCK